MEEVEHLVYEEYDTKKDEVMAIIVTAVATWASCVNILSQVEAVVRNIGIKHTDLRRWDKLNCEVNDQGLLMFQGCLLYTSPSPRDGLLSRMPSSA